MFPTKEEKAYQKGKNDMLKALYNLHITKRDKELLDIINDKKTKPKAPEGREIMEGFTNIKDKKKKWEKEFEDYLRYDLSCAGICVSPLLYRNFLGNVMREYLQKGKVRIKCRNGVILIERIE